jgi:hypothetical protein
MKVIAGERLQIPRDSLTVHIGCFQAEPDGHFHDFIASQLRMMIVLKVLAQRMRTFLIVLPAV